MSSKIYSMTGSASYDGHNLTGQCHIELISVNNRYLDCNIRLSDNLKFLEGLVRKTIAQRLERGKIECIINYAAADAEGLKLNTQLLESLTKTLEGLGQNFKQHNVDLLALLNFPGVIELSINNNDALQELILNGLVQALDKLLATRESEGKILIAALEDKFVLLEKQLELLKPQLKDLVNQQRLRLQQRLDSFEIKVDEQRLEQEVVLAAQKADIAEEYDRLCSHIVQLRHIIAQGGAIGKRLDFMCQELNREANTLASKASNLELTSIAVELKVIIEQIREQVQNLQ